MALAPVALFVYCRPDHSLKTLEALAKNQLADQTELYIFCDGAKEPSDARVAEVREVVRAFHWPGQKTVIEREQNMGLAQSIFSGVTQVLEEHANIIVVEDDIVTAPGFLQFHNNALAEYSSEPRVFAVSGYSHPIDHTELKDDTFLICWPSSWGWSTWSDAWKDFKLDERPLLERAYEGSTDRVHSMPERFRGMLKKQLEGAIDSWAIQWYAHIYMKDGLFLFPKRSLVENIGFDGSGRHSTNTGVFQQGNSLQHTPEVVKLPIVQNDKVRAAIDHFFVSMQSNPKPSLKQSLKKIWRNVFP